MILTFWCSTVLVELFGSDAAIATVKQAIPWGFLLLVPALASTGATGWKLAGRANGPRIRAKKRRMPIIAANGLLVLVPVGLFLSRLAARGDFGTSFQVAQAVELTAGLINLVLMSMSVRDGLRLTGRRRVQLARGSPPTKQLVEGRVDG